MRDIREGNCPLCNHDVIVEGVPGEFAEQLEVTPAFTYDPRWVLGGRNPGHPHGPLMYYMCRKCGFLQWFVSGPGDVPIGEEYRTRLIEGKAGQGPFR